MVEGKFQKRITMYCDSAEPDRIKMWQKAGYRARPVKKEPNSVKAQIDYLKQHTIPIHRVHKSDIRQDPVLYASSCAGDTLRL